MVSRKQFIESVGGTCANWTWSWSFVNHDAKFVIFGAWDAYEEGGRELILDKSWTLSRKGQRQAAYPQSREHIRLIEQEGYSLKTFPMQYGYSDPTDPYSPAKIIGFTPELHDRQLIRVGSSWYASDSKDSTRLPQELDSSEILKEGAAVSVRVNSYERNAKARQQCLAHHGHTCAVCGFDFVKVYGPIAASCIHVHHLVPIADIGKEYVVDPIKDLVPICPNCHAVIHSARPALGLDQLQSHLNGSTSNTHVEPVEKAPGKKC